MSRITSLSMSLLDMITLLSDGNPGALSAMVELATTAEQTDPDSALGAMGPIMFLDTLGIYGSDIWVLFNDICGRSPVKMQALLRAVQMGIANESEIKSGISAYRLGADRDASNARVDALLAAVQEALPRFAASVGRNPEGEDRATELRRNDEHAVPNASEADARD
jgi:hypothetical protein